MRPTRLSMICAHLYPRLSIRAQMAGLETCSGGVRRPSPHTHNLKKFELLKKDRTGRPYSAPTVARQSFVTVPYRGSLTNYIKHRPAMATATHLHNSNPQFRRLCQNIKIDFELQEDSGEHFYVPTATYRPIPLCHCKHSRLSRKIPIAQDSA